MFGSSAVHAQGTDSLRIAVGGRGGAGVSNVHYQPYQETNHGLMYEGGLTLRMTRNQYVAFLLELNYLHTSHSTKEYAVREYVQTPYFTSNEEAFLQCHQDWVTLPLLMQVYYNFPWFTLQVVGGGVVDYLWNERLQYGSTPLGRQPLYWSTHHCLGLGMAAGAAVGLTTPVGVFLLEYRFTYRVIDVYARKRIPRVAEPVSRLLSHYVGLSYYYRLK